MSEKKKQYWTADAILSTKADINMVLGEKGNGKSYDIKYRFAGDLFCLFRKDSLDMKRERQFAKTADFV